MATPAFLVRLMHFAGLSRSVKLGPEDSEAYRFAIELRAATLEGRLLAVWTHPANELGGMVTKTKGRDGTAKVRVPVAVAIARAVGLITGTSDYLFLFEDGSLAIEFKSATGRLTPAQTDFFAWCRHVGVPYHLVRSAGEGLDVLRSMGLLNDARPQ